MITLKLKRIYCCIGVFESVVAGVFQSIFYLKIYQNNISFYFLKIIFDISTSK